MCSLELLFLSFVRADPPQGAHPTKEHSKHCIKSSPVQVLQSPVIAVELALRRHRGSLLLLLINGTGPRVMIWPDNNIIFLQGTKKH